MMISTNKSLSSISKLIWRGIIDCEGQEEGRPIGEGHHCNLSTEFVKR